MNTYNELLVEVKLFLNKKLYEEKIISYEIFESMEKRLIERTDK